MNFEKKAKKWYKNRGINTTYNQYGYFVIEVNGVYIRPNDFEIMDRASMYDAEKKLKKFGKGRIRMKNG